MLRLCKTIINFISTEAMQLTIKMNIKWMILSYMFWVLGTVLNIYDLFIANPMRYVNNNIPV